MGTTAGSKALSISSPYTIIIYERKYINVKFQNDILTDRRTIVITTLFTKDSMLITE
jgi:hypothetical protein